MNFDLETPKFFSWIVQLAFNNKAFHSVIGLLVLDPRKNPVQLYFYALNYECPGIIVFPVTNYKFYSYKMPRSYKINSLHVLQC